MSKKLNIYKDGGESIEKVKNLDILEQMFKESWKEDFFAKIHFPLL